MTITTMTTNLATPPVSADTPARDQQDDDQRVLKTDKELAPKRHGFHVRRVVFAIARKPGLKVRVRQTLDFRLQLGQQATRRIPARSAQAPARRTRQAPA